MSNVISQRKEDKPHICSKDLANTLSSIHLKLKKTTANAKDSTKDCMVRYTGLQHVH